MPAMMLNLLNRLRQQRPPERRLSVATVPCQSYGLSCSVAFLW